MNTFLSLFKRKALFPALITLLLLLAISITSAGAAMRIGVTRQVANVSNNYVTIAVPAEYQSPSEIEANADPSLTDEEISMLIFGLMPKNAREAAMKSDFVQAVDNRYIMGAQVMGSKALTSAALDPMRYVNQLDSESYKMAVFAIKCQSISEIEYSTDELWNPYVEYIINAEIIDTVSLADGYPDIDDDSFVVYESNPETENPPVSPFRNIEISTNLYSPDGTIPFQEGGTYLVYGYYRDFPVLNSISFDPKTGAMIEQFGRVAGDYNRLFILDDIFMLDYRANGVVFDYSEEMLDSIYHRHRAVRSDGKTYFYPNEDLLPRWAEYSGSWKDFLASEEGRIWREEIIPLCEINHSSATVLLSDNLQSMYVFNSGEAGLLEGRFFTEEEYASGDEVCMISASYAQYNGYRVGDKLTLDLYDTGFFEDVASVNSSDFAVISRGACTPDRRIGVKKEYEVVGIYSAPEFSAGALKFRADTILLPKKSVPGSEAYERFDARLLYSLILKNGTQEEFQAHMEQAGSKDAFLYFDQGYTVTEGSLEAMNENAMRIFWIGLATLILTAALAHFLSLRRFAPAARTMRLLGVDRKTVQHQTLGMLLLTDAAAAVLGVGLAAALFSRITERALSFALKPEPLVLAACAGVIFLLLLISSLICAKGLSNMPLMQTEKKNRH